MRFHVVGVGSLGTLVAHHLQRVLRLSRTHAASAAALAAARSTPRSKGIGFPEEDAASASPQVASSSQPQPTSNFTRMLRDRAKKGTQPKPLPLPAPYAHPYLPPVDSSYVTLHLRRRAHRREIVRQGAKQGYVDLTVERDGVRSVEPSLRVEYTHSPGAVGEMLLGQGAADLGNDRDHIDALILTTKADVTIPALRPLVSRLSSRSTVVLLQNGLGVLEALYERLFPTPETRPHFILASTTHGAWRRGALTSTHASFGSLHFGIVPDQRYGEGYERTMEERERIALSTSPVGLYSRGGGWVPHEGAGNEQDAATERSNLLSLTSLPSLPNSTLRPTVAALLSLPLDVHWEPIRAFQLRALRKLVINACINPLTALVGCRNGDLFGNTSARNTMQLVCEEASAVLEAQARAALQEQAGEPATSSDPSSLTSMDLLTSTGPDGTPALDGSLHPRVLLAEVERVASLTSRNWSSMAQDLGVHISPNAAALAPRAGNEAAPQMGGVGRGATEIAHINGYLASLGARYRIPTPVNTTLVHLINLKSSKTSSRWRGSM